MFSIKACKNGVENFMKDISYNSKIRLHVKNKIFINDSLSVENKQAHYLKTVMRRKINEKIFIFNENDGEFETEITEINKNKVILKINQYIPLIIRDIS